MEFENVPKHIGIIMDGNRRFAKKIMAKPWKGHEWGKEKFKKVLEWAKEFQVKEMTFYAMSIQNFSRPKKEFDYLMKLFNEGLDEWLKENPVENGMKINFIGRTSMFPTEIQEKMKKLMELTKDNNKYILNMAMAYGGREEVIDAVKKLSKKLADGDIKESDINEDVISEELYTKSEPDLIIRTGGERRTSNFLLWQSHYSEWIFLEKTWPDFEKEDFIECINDYCERERRFGK